MTTDDRGSATNGQYNLIPIVFSFQCKVSVVKVESPIG